MSYPPWELRRLSYNCALKSWQKFRESFHTDATPGLGLEETMWNLLVELYFAILHLPRASQIGNMICQRESKLRNTAVCQFAFVKTFLRESYTILEYPLLRADFLA